MGIFSCLVNRKQSNMHLIIISVLVGLSLASHDSSQCTDGFSEFGGKCYFFKDHKSNWQDAQDWCKHHGAYLAEITSKTENEIILELMTANGEGTVWLGGEDLDMTGKWHWNHSGDRIKCSNFCDWSPGNPGSKDDPTDDERCMEFQKGPDGMMMNASMNRNLCARSPQKF